MTPLVAEREVTVASLVDLSARVCAFPSGLEWLRRTGRPGQRYAVVVPMVTILASLLPQKPKKPRRHEGGPTIGVTGRPRSAVFLRSARPQPHGRQRRRQQPRRADVGHLPEPLRDVVHAG